MAHFKFPVSALNGKQFVTQIITDKGNLHCHEFFEFAYVIHGKVKHVTPQNEAYLTNNTLVIVRPDDLHAFDEEGDPHNCHRDIIVNANFFKELCDFISPTLYGKIVNRPSVIFCNLQQPVFNLLEDRLTYYASAEKQNPELAKSIAFSALSLLVNTFLNNDAATEQDKNSSIYLHILQTISLPYVLQYGIPALLEKLNYSHGHICRIVKACSGKTLLSILTEKRMEFAANLLKTTDYKLTDVAAAVGYDSLSHFINVFKKEIGASPIKYKKNSTFDHVRLNLFGANEK